MIVAKEKYKDIYIVYIDESREDEEMYYPELLVSLSDFDLAVQKASGALLELETLHGSI